MEALSGCARRQGLANATLRREVGSLSCSQGPSIALCARGKMHVTERMQATSSDAELDTMAYPGSIVQQTLGNRIEPFSRPTQILSSQEVLNSYHLPDRVLARVLVGRGCITDLDRVWFAGGRCPVCWTAQQCSQQLYGVLFLRAGGYRHGSRAYDRLT